MNNYQNDFTNMHESHENNVGQSFPDLELAGEASQVCLAAPDEINQAATDVEQSRAEMFVTFNAHGGTLPPSTPNPRWVWRGGAIGTLPIPIRAGFIFTGWWNGNTQINANTIIWHDMTIMASWRAQPLELLSNATVAAIRGSTVGNVPLQDLRTGRTLLISMATPGPRIGSHTDWTPMSPADVTTIQRILDPHGNITNWNLESSWRPWVSRPGVLSLNGRRIAVGFHLVPHGSIIRPAAPGLPLRDLTNIGPPWPVGGHMCMYYGIDSDGETPDGNAMAREAHRNWR